MMVFNSCAKTMKTDNGGPKDMISCLPDNVIDCIIDHLPLHDIARMAVISRKWRDIWKSLTHLKFDGQFFNKVLEDSLFEESDFYLIISRVLLSHRGGSIPRFFLHIPYAIPKIPEIGLFFNFLSYHGVTEITIENCWYSSLSLPSDIFSCLELRSLKLDFCTINVPPTFKGFIKLIRLELVNVIFTSDDTFGSFISSCPLLQNLILNGLSGVDNPTINAPDLKHLEVLGTFKSLSLRSCQGLSSIEIGLLEKVANYRDNKASDLFEFLSCCKIQELSIKGNFFEFMSTPCHWVSNKRTFKELKLLQLSNVDANSIFQFTFACGLIQSCLNMEELIISFRSSACPMEYNVESDDACLVFSCLRKIYIYSITDGVAELNLIKFLLWRSPLLEKVYVKRSPKIRSISEWKLARALMRFPRASAKAEVIYMDYVNIFSQIGV